MEVRFKISGWFEKPVVLPVLLYRRIQYGYAFRRIRLSQKKYAIVDPEDYARLSKYKWYAAKSRKTFYARRGRWCKTRKRKLLEFMHNLVIDVPAGHVADHINHNGLDNRKANLRPATSAENTRNCSIQRENTSSKYRGVWYNKQIKKWRAKIVFNNKRYHIGYFENEVDAGKAYDEAARKYHGEFAALNFPELAAESGGEAGLVARDP